MFIEKRSNWSEMTSKKAQQRQAQKMKLLIDLDEIREQLKIAPISSFDKLKLQQREIIAKLATL